MVELVEQEVLVREANEQLEQASLETVIVWAIKHYPLITLASSFGAEDVVLVDMLQKVDSSIPIFYLDTDFYFKETYDTINKLSAHYGVEFMRVAPQWTPEQQASLYGEQLWKSNPNACCNLRKVQPLTETLSQYDAWITGIRRDQAPTRAQAKIVEVDQKFDLMKFNPLANWTTQDVWDYIRKHNVIYNPLHDEGYPSIGCHYCTRPVAQGDDPRAGRWSDSDKTECGLHK